MGWWYELRGSSGSLLMFGTSYATEEAAIRAAEVAKRNISNFRFDVRIRTGFTTLKSVDHNKPRPLA
jgi:hypothetical protein